MMDDLASKEGGEDYKTFWESFGRNLKVGGVPGVPWLVAFWRGGAGGVLAMGGHAH